MSLKLMYLIRSADTGRMATVMANSERAALRQYVDDKNPPPGEFFIKERGSSSDWNSYDVA